MVFNYIINNFPVHLYHEKTFPKRKLNLLNFKAFLYTVFSYFLILKNYKPSEKLQQFNEHLDLPLLISFPFFLPSFLPSFFVLLNHLQVSCRHHYTSSLNTSACIYLRTRAFSCITTIQLSHLGMLTWIQHYNLIQSIFKFSQLSQ